MSQGIHIAPDAAGNVIVAGFFVDSMDVDPGPGIQILSHYPGYGIPFVEKLDSNGNLVWAFAIGTDSTGVTVEDLAVDDLGNTYVTGMYEMYVDIDPGPSVVLFTGNYPISGYLLKVDPNGQFVWAVNLDSDGPLYPGSVAVDSAGAVIAVGKFKGNADLDPGPSTSGLSSLDGSVYVAKYDDNGGYLWGAAVLSAWDGPRRTNGGTVDAQGNILVTGRYVNGADFDPGSGVVQVPMPAQAIGTFVWKLTGAGNFEWVSATGMNTNTGETEAYDICTDPQGNVFSAGIFSDTVDFDNGAGASMLISKGESDMVVQKLDANGNFQWARSIGGQFFDSESVVATDRSGNVYFGGNLRDTTDLDPGPGVHMFNAPLYSMGSFVEKLDSAGNMVELMEFGDTAIGYHGVYGIAMDPLGAVLVTGLFNKPTDFDPGPGVSPLFPQAQDSYILRLHAPKPLVSIQSGMWTDFMTVFPNPGKGRFELEFGQIQSQAQFTIRNLAGQVILEGGWQDVWRVEVEVTGPAGLYFLDVQNDQGDVSRHKLVKE